MFGGKTKRIVLTGGPCAGKTTLTQVLSHVFHHEAVVIPEAASLLFTGGFPRWQEADSQRSTQRAIFHVQTELENTFQARYPGKFLILDRGTVDGAAYWPEGPEQFFKSLNTTLEQEFIKYDQVIYLESAAKDDYLANLKKNPNRTETWEQAHLLDEITLRLWQHHPKMVWIRNQRNFHAKIAEVVELISRDVMSESQIQLQIQKGDL